LFSSNTIAVLFPKFLCIWLDTVFYKWHEFKILPLGFYTRHTVSRPTRQNLFQLLFVMILQRLPICFSIISCKLIIIISNKAVPLLTMQVLRGKGGRTPTHSWPRH
jgi:hypothetical protein